MQAATGVSQTERAFHTPWFDQKSLILRARCAYEPTSSAASESAACSSPTELDTLASVSASAVDRTWIVEIVNKLS